MSSSESTTFSTMLKEYAPNELLENTVIKLNWFLKKVKKDPKWGMGAYQIPVELQENSRFEFGALPASSDIQVARYGKPEVSSPAELFGALKFHSKDLERHDGDMKKSFLQIAPKKIKQFAQRMEETASITLLGDGSICTLTANGAVDGTITVNRPWLLTGGQKVYVADGNSNVTGYIKPGSIDINAKTAIVVESDMTTAVDCSGITTAQSGKVYVPGFASESFTSLIDIVFPASLGGADTLYGGAITKLASPVYQPFSKDISSSTTYAALKNSLFDFYYEAEQMGRSDNDELLVPYSVFKALALGTEDIRQKTNDDVKSMMGARSMELIGPNGNMKVTGVRDMADGYVVKMDWDSVVFASRGELIKNANALGEDYFTERATTGYTHIADRKLEGELIVTAPAKLAGAKVATTFTAS